MNLEVLSFEDSLSYKPKDRTYAIRIFGEFNMNWIYDLQESDKWVGINRYTFDDMWTKEWKEYSDIDFSEPNFSRRFGVTWERARGDKLTEDVFLDWKEYEGHPYGRFTLFDRSFARDIMDDFEKVQNKVDTVMIHCHRGKNRSPAVGIAMNEIYGWGIMGLKERFPEYRRFVYSKMIEEANRGKLIK
jgi:hypothetical protein